MSASGCHGALVGRFTGYTRYNKARRSAERCYEGDGTMNLWMRLPSVTAGEYECRNCGERYDVQHHVCPNCAGFSVDTTADVERSYEANLV